MTDKWLKAGVVEDGLLRHTAAGSPSQCGVMTMEPGQGYGGTQDRGCRQRQEDAFHFEPLTGPDGVRHGLLMALSDGMGGHTGGQYASAAAIEAFVQSYATESEPEADRLQKALLAANQRIAREADANPGLRGMGCTLVGASLTSVGLHLISVGDSVAYLFRNGQLERLNADHSMGPVLQQAVALGTLKQEEVDCHPHRQALRSAVMGRDLSLVDLRREPLELLPGDKVLLASDGFLTLPEARMVELLDQHTDQTAAALSGILVEAVTSAANPHQDNVTVMVAALPATQAEPVKQASFWTRLLPRRERKLAAIEHVLQPRILVLLGAGFLVAALVAGVVTTWHQWRPLLSIMPSFTATDHREPPT